MNGELTIKEEFHKICEEIRLREMATMDTVDQCDYNTGEIYHLKQKASDLYRMAYNGMVKSNELSEKTIAKWKKELEHIDMDAVKMPSPYELMKERWADID